MGNKGLLWRISANVETGLAGKTFQAEGIPVPETVEYRPWQQSVTVGDGQQRTYGRESMTLRWERMSRVAYFDLCRFITESQNDTGLLYMTVDRVNYENSHNYFVDVTGFPHLPVDTPHIGTYVGTEGPEGFSNVLLYLNNVVIVHDPSIYTVF